MSTLQKTQEVLYPPCKKKHRRDYVHLAKAQHVHKRKIACHGKTLDFCSYK